MNDKQIHMPASGVSRGPLPPALQWSWTHLAYFVGVPLVVAVYAGLNNWEIRHVAGITGSLTFYAAHAFPPWWTTCLCTLGAKKALGVWKPPWLVLLLIGHLVGSLITTPYSNWLTGKYVEELIIRGIRHDDIVFFSADFWLYTLRAGAIWLGINFLFDRFLGLPLYRYEIPRGFDAPGSSDAQAAQSLGHWPDRAPAFVSRLPQPIGPQELQAIKAEQHYIKILGSGKSQMVLYRFSDAINELPPEMGMQVHRSYWVNSAAIKAVHAKAKDFYLLLQNDQKVPVSGPYQGMIRELARNLELPLLG